MSGIDQQMLPALTPGSSHTGEWPGEHAAVTDVQPLETDTLLAFTGQEERRYGFRIGHFRWLVKSGINSEVVLSPAITPIPLSPPWLLGLINLRSNLVPVFDLHTLCGTPGQGRSIVLVLDTGEKAVGIPIDALPAALKNPTRAEQLPALPEAFPEVDTGYLADDEVWLEFDHDRVFSFVNGS